MESENDLVPELPPEGSESGNLGADGPDPNEAARRTYQGLAYVNAYAVTRHYGGPEEGGWWYNRGTPLASVPIPCTFTEDHDTDGDGTTFGDDQVGWCTGCFSDDGERRKICAHTTWEADANASEHMIAYLKAAFADVNDGDIYSVCGGTDVQIQLDTEQACEWPRATPRYE